MNRVWAVYYRSLLIDKRRALKVLSSMVITPLLYAAAFGWGLGEGLSVEGVPYILFMLPGLMAISSMNQSFGIGTEINIARFFNRQFEEFLLSPARPAGIVTGFVLYGMTKGLVSFGLILCVSTAVASAGGATPLVVIPVFLNCFLFSSLGVLISLSVGSHRDMNTFTSFVMVPMSFLAGTFFSISRLPSFLRIAANVLPLTHASAATRALYLSRPFPYFRVAVLAAYGVLFFLLALRAVHKAAE